MTLVILAGAAITALLVVIHLMLRLAAGVEDTGSEDQLDKGEGGDAG